MKGHRLEVHAIPHPTVKIISQEAKRHDRVPTFTTGHQAEKTSTHTQSSPSSRFHV